MWSNLHQRKDEKDDARKDGDPERLCDGDRTIAPVEDIFQARQELVQAGIELVGPLQEDKPTGYTWQHFRGPDGKLYELTYNPEQIGL